MKNIAKFGLALFAGLVFSGTSMAEDRYVTIGGGATEIVVALGATDKIVAVDITSYYPPNLQEDLPSVGYIRRAPAEGIIAQSPTHIIAEDDLGPQATVDALGQTDIKLHLLQPTRSIEDVLANITSVAEFIGMSEKASEITSVMSEDMTALQAAIGQLDGVSAAIIYQDSKGSFIGIGNDNDTDTMLQMAGGVNVFGDTAARVTISKETLLARKPAVIFTFAHILRRAGLSLDDFKALPVIAESEAGKTGRVFVLPGGFISAMGPRTVHATAWLAKVLHGDDAIPDVAAREWAVELQRQH